MELVSHLVVLLVGSIILATVEYATERDLGWWRGLWVGLVVMHL